MYYEDIMSQMDSLIAGIRPNKQSPSKEKLWEFVKESLAEIGQINEAYKKYFESGSAEAPAVFNDIEAKIEKIKLSYASLFDVQESGDSKVAELNKKIEEILAFHSQLLTGESSVQTNVEAAHKKIQELYVFLFGNDVEDGIHPELKEAIASILESKKDISEFETRLNDEIKPNLVEVQKDIDTKRTEIGALLSNATINTLAHGYAESKYEYSKPAPKKYVKIGTGLDILWTVIANISAFIFNVAGRHISFIVSYILFIFPLVAVSLIFMNEDAARIVLNSLAQENVAPSPLELIYVKTVISVPLIWVAWYGQRNISQRKRLYEEYNHKLRVVQMYLMFSTKEESYPLSSMLKLEETLIEVIGRNPSEVFGKDETILDKFADIVKASKGIADNTTKAIKKEANAIVNEIAKG